MIVNIIIAVLAYFLAGAFPIIQKGLPAFVLWCIILFFLAGVGFARVDNKNRWIY